MERTGGICNKLAYRKNLYLLKEEAEGTTVPATEEVH